MSGHLLPYNADMPMASAQPLFLMDCAVNRTTVCGRVAGPVHHNSPEGALRAVTLKAANSLQLSNKVGSIIPGKLASFCHPFGQLATVPAATIKDIKVSGTVQAGHKLPMQHQDVYKFALGP